MSNVESILGSIREALVRTSPSLLVDDAAFGSSLRIGQIITARVMRHYEGGRYAMDFGGRERVVDSTMPLRISEVVTARVVAVGDQVHLQRLRADGEAASDLAAGVRARSQTSPNESAIQALFGQYNATPSPTEVEALTHSMRRVPNPGLATLSGLVLQKLGVPVSPELIAAMYRRLDGTSSVRSRSDTAVHGRLALDSQAVRGASERAFEQLADHLRVLAGSGEPAEAGEMSASDREDELVETDGGSSGGYSGGDGLPDTDREWLLGQWLLNAQSHPRIAQRLMHLPLWIGDQMIEVSVALFSERERSGDQSSNGRIPFQRAVFFLELEHLGKVQVTVNAVDRSLRLKVVAEASAAADALAGEMGTLRTVLSALDWEVAELTLLQARLSAGGQVVDAIVHHHITQDSLSRWM